MMTKELVCSALIATLLMGGCSVLNDPNDPRHVKNDDNIVVLMQADRRAVFTFDKGKSGRVCPEPSPDVKADVESTLKSLISGSATIPQGISVDAKQELEATRKLITQALLKRSQGLQVLRDMLFQSCLANLRGDMPPEKYTSFLTVTLPRLASTLITTELVSAGASEGKSLPKEVVEAILKYQIVNAATP